MSYKNQRTNQEYMKGPIDSYHESEKPLVPFINDLRVRIRSTGETGLVVGRTESKVEVFLDGSRRKATVFPVLLEILDEQRIPRTVAVIGTDKSPAATRELRPVWEGRQGTDYSPDTRTASKIEMDKKSNRSA